MNPYSNNKCKCGAVATMMSTNFTATRYYCTKHSWSVIKKIDDWMKLREDKQWGNTDWYKAAQPKKRKPKQLKLTQ